MYMTIEIIRANGDATAGYRRAIAAACDLRGWVKEQGDIGGTKAVDPDIGCRIHEARRFEVLGERHLCGSGVDITRA